MATKENDFVQRDGRVDVRAIDKDIKNKFKWAWMDEEDTNDYDDAVDDDDDDDNNDYAQGEHRASARLANKRRINYKQMHMKGKDDW